MVNVTHIDEGLCFYLFSAAFASYIIKKLFLNEGLIKVSLLSIRYALYRILPPSVVFFTRRNTFDDSPVESFEAPIAFILNKWYKIFNIRLL